MDLEKFVRDFNEVQDDSKTVLWSLNIIHDGFVLDWVYYGSNFNYCVMDC